MLTWRLAWLMVMAVAACGGGSGGPDAATGGSCSGLTMAECRERPDCVADECIECSCTPVFEGCRRPTDPEMCPDLECLEPPCCDTQPDCDPSGAICAPPGTPTGCGIPCDPTGATCTSDADCDPATTGMVCHPFPCCIAEGAGMCGPGCDETGCGPGTVCGATSARCEPAPCSETEPCPGNFDCVAPGPTAEHCARRPCVIHADCEGWCVVGTCLESLGECWLPTP